MQEVKRVPCIALLIFAGACSSGRNRASAAPAQAASACSCPCAAQTGASPAAPAAAAGVLGELVASASRKMMHDDGAGCLADLDQLANVDPALSKRLAVTRGQCEMLVGNCREGKQRIADWYRAETNLSQERADAVAESLASTRCRGGDSSERDELLRAFYELSDGAYLNKKEPSVCRERLATVKRLLPLVKPRDPDDAQVISAPNALFHTAAMCFARAGDCSSSWSSYRDNYPADGLAALKDPKQRQKVIEDSFRSTVERCKDAI
jgi:hypothetical protein